jgi:site-specific DNA recombinase
MHLFENIISGSPKIEKVVVCSFSRLSRDMDEYSQRAAFLSQHKIPLISVEHQVSDAEWVDRIFYMWHKHEASAHRTQIINLKKANAQRGHFNGGPVPYGYRSIEILHQDHKCKKKLQIEPAEAKVIRMAFNLYLRGS